MRRDNNLYPSFSFEYLFKKEKKNSIDFSSSKKILMNSQMFKNYIQNYIPATQRIPSITPSSSFYPIFKKKAGNLFSLNNTIFNNTNEKTTLNSTLKHSLSNPNYFNRKNKTNKFSKLKLNKIKVFNLDFPSLMSPLKLQNMEPLKLSQKKIIRSSSNINNKIYIRNDILVEDFLYKWKDSKLNYEERNIFNQNEIYTKFINDNLISIKTEKIENTTSKLESSFEDKNGDIIKLKLFPLTIKFIPINDEENKFKENIIEIPFSYHFLFYYKGIELLQRILLATIKFNKDYTKVYFDDEELYKFIRNNNDKPENDIVNQNIIPRHFSLKNPQPTFSRRISKKISRKFSCFEEKENVEDNKITINNIDNNIPKKNIYNEYEFIWITPDINFNVKITIPYIIFDWIYLNKPIKKYIERDLLIFLIMNNFLDWEFFAINYLFSFKMFRNYIELNLSKRKENEKLYSNKETNNKKDDNFYLISYRNIYKFKAKDLIYCFFMTNEMHINSFFTIHYYSIKVNFDELNLKKKWIVNFNYSQMKFLNQIKKYQSLDEFIPKILIFDFEKQDLKINYSVFRDFSPNILNYKRFEVDVEEYKKNSLDYFPNYIKPSINKKSLNIQIEKPYLDKIYYKSNLNRIKKEKIEFNDEFIIKLNEINLNDLPSYILNNKKEWIINNQNNDFLKNYKNHTNKRKHSFMPEAINLKKIPKTFRKLNSVVIDYKK